MEMMNVTLGNQNETMNFMFGLAELEENFDVLNNPYVQFVGHEMSEDPVKMIMDQKYEIGLCDQSHIENFVEDHTLSWYSQPLCFKNRDEVKVHKNWFMPGFAFPTISIAYC